ncbi:entericidin A/B family lipoprotein [Meridianimarinicoccus sp. RP-17]|nr:entericidin, EcnA/B family [Phycocomes zhengii]
MARSMVLGLTLLALAACEPVGQGVQTVGGAISNEAENPRNERPE